MTFKINPLLAVDSYKLSHHKMYTPGTEVIYSNFTPRSTRLFNGGRFFDGKITVFGVTAMVQHIHELWNEEFFYKPKSVCEKYAEFIAPFCGGMAVDVSHIEELHDFGRLPVVFRALPEGARVNAGIPILTVHNTNPKFYWLTNYIETYISNNLWKPCTVATIASVYRRMLDHYAKVTGSPTDFVGWQGHDFSCRGMTCMEDAAMASAGHLVYFTGTDTLVAVDYINYYYDGQNTFVGGSVPASEHSVMTLDGTEGEFELFKRIINETVPNGVVSLVADGFDYWKVLTEYAAKLKDDILARGNCPLGLSKVVFRPDSGDPVKILTGYTNSEYAEIVVDGKLKFVCKVTGKELSEAEVKGSVEVLWEIFGGTETETGHKLLNSHVGLIYGDSITLERAEQILERLHKKGFASGNVVFGIGSYTYNYITRDTLGFAMKATYAVVDGVPRNVFKDPKTDAGGKRSAKGLLSVEKDEHGEYVLVQEADVKLDDYRHGDLSSVDFMVYPSSFSTIRERALKSL